ncbi:MarR family winged helix-turn-helix transcriptional regulator [Pseudonocardia zijingensis]|jgi:DNA-binding MarR family transcriptional regulator|uniref:MarR family transcriptional regulator n=1 Tax=Pseudonocardia zijingensis TaxID=153376 RepID=A0ABN1Q0W2_9PSEU
MDDQREQDLGELLVSVSARLSRLYGRVLGQLDISLTYRQHRLLRRVSEGHTSMAVLAEIGNLTVPTVSESVEGLVRRGLLDRQVNPQNRRQMVLSLTAEGRRAKEAGDVALEGVNGRLLRAVPDEHRQVLEESLASLYGAATEAFRQPDAIAPAAAGAARPTET